MSNLEETAWYSARLRIAIVVEGAGVWQYMECVHVFLAAGWPVAFERALVLGRAHEKEYSNTDGRLVRWRLNEILTLDLLSVAEIDGAEVYSEFTDAGPADSADGSAFDRTLHPEQSQPRQTI